MSVRVERLSDRGLVSRVTDPADRRNSLVSLTEAGRALFDAVTPAHMATENRLLSALGEHQRGRASAEPLSGNGDLTARHLRPDRATLPARIRRRRVPRRCRGSGW